MANEKGIAHRSGMYKQTNKGHKTGRHRSKGTINGADKGKISLKTMTKINKREMNKEQRRNQASQIRQHKRDEVLNKKRSLGGMENAPFLICIVPLNKNLDPTSALMLLLHCDEEALLSRTSTGITHLNSPRFKKRFSFVVPQLDNDFAVLDCLKIADTVLFLASAGMGYENDDLVIDKWGESMITSVFAQGLPTPVIALTNLESIAPKKKQKHKQEIQSLIEKWFPDEKLMVLDKYVDGLNVLRKFSDQKIKSLVHRDNRPYLLGEEVDFIPNEDEEEGDDDELGTLKITGYLRGSSLSVNQLIYIPGMGEYQMSQIDTAIESNKYVKTRNNDMIPDSYQEVKMLDECDPSKQESLDSEHFPDPMDAEQTWPTNEELEMADAEKKLKKIKKIPKGWSDYQAAWIPDDEGEFQQDNEEEDEEEEDEYMKAFSEENSDTCEDKSVVEFDAMSLSEVSVNDERYDRNLDFHAEMKDLEKLKAARNDQEFPDEVDTPLDQPARLRFQKYRGLESFRTSPWDVKESLPSDYARIFQFENLAKTKKRILKEHEDKNGTPSGWYITVHVSNVLRALWEDFESMGSPMTFVGLYPHEQKMSVVNVVLKRTKEYDLPIKSKEKLIFQCGYRRFVADPVFSSHTTGKRHKFERFFQPDSIAVATFYAPIQFPPAPVLCYKNVDDRLVLVASGSLLSCDPDRMVIKRVILSGHPVKIHKRSSVVRFMFFNREDINYFKPCKLRTKLGRNGHIKEALGTHGHMKCIFDGQLKSHDTVLLYLYKRVFPKWSYEDVVATSDD